MQTTQVAYHPKTDGQSEAANSAVLHSLICYMANKKSMWENYLEFAYNNTMHASIGEVPFEVIYGKVVLPPILCTRDYIFVVDECMQDLQDAYAKVWTAIKRSQKKKPQRSKQINIDSIWILKKVTGCY